MHQFVHLNKLIYNLNESRLFQQFSHFWTRSKTAPTETLYQRTKNNIIKMTNLIKCYMLNGKTLHFAKSSSPLTV